MASSKKKPNKDSANKDSKTPSHTTLDGTPEERMQLYLQSEQTELMDSGLYIGNPANDFCPDVEWQQHGNASYLVFKNTDSLDDPSTNPKSTNNFTQFHTCSIVSSHHRNQ